MSRRTFDRKRPLQPREIEELGAKLDMSDEDEGITVLNCKDQRNVLMLSTKHSKESVEVNYRGGTKLKPVMICEYNKAKSSVDLSDQMGAYNNPLRAWGAMGWGGTAEGGLRRRMPLRRAGGGSATTGGYGPAGGRAMRYYRLWIYTCNTALLAGALAFTGAAVKTLLFDFRRSLVPSLTLYQPSFLYAYLALATQGGALQLLGCVAALKLSERLLNAYWLLLLVLIFGDVVIGAFWAYRFERICQELRPALRLRFQQEYGSNSALTSLWDRLQAEDQCCGVTGPDEFDNTTGTVRWEMPPSCCLETTGTSNVTRCSKIHAAGCDERLLAYLRSTASLLAILGYCVLAFLKMCFLGILRYEIREMIQKIRILRAELELPNVNGAVPGTLRAEGAESERESLLVRPESTALLSSPPTQPKNPNGNNNYEMREYQRSHDNI